MARKKIDSEAAREALVMARSAVEDALSHFNLDRKFVSNQLDRDDWTREALELLLSDPVRWWLDIHPEPGASGGAIESVRKARDLLRRALE